MVQFNRNRKQENDDYELDEIDEQEEFDGIEDADDDESSDEPNPWIKRGIIIGAIGLTICGAILIRALTSNDTQNPQTEVTTTVETTVAPVTIPEESTTTTDATVTLKGKAALSDEELQKQMEANRRELNAMVNSYEQISGFRLYEEEFEKTPKRSIKRFLYADAEI